MDYTKSNVSLKTEYEDLEVEYDVFMINKETSTSLSNTIAKKREIINSGIQDNDTIIADLQKEVDGLNEEIERLTYNGDTLDLLVAASSGVLTGLLDIVFVGELGLFEGSSDASKARFENDLGGVHESMNRFIQKYAKKSGFKGDKLKDSIEFLEKKYPVAQDNSWSGKQISSTKTHHLDDLAHHPSVLGLVSALAVQYLRISTFASTDGSVHFVFVKPSKKDIMRIIIPVVISGLILWLVNLAESKIEEYDIDIPKPVKVIVDNLYKAPIAIEILRTVLNWGGHLVSDMGGSKNTPGGGEGIPGIFASFIKEISMMPGFKDSDLPKIAKDLYRGNMDSPLTHKLDLRTEMAVVKEQAMPVIVNEVIVRTFYFVRHLIIESKDKEIKDINWRNVVPFYNRTIVRMMTVASGTFTAVDLIDAAAETAIKHPETLVSGPAFLGKMVMCVNFVGIGRFAIAVTTDVGMGIQKMRDENKRAILMQNLIQANEAKMYYCSADAKLEIASLRELETNMYDAEADMWKQLSNSSKSINELYGLMYNMGDFFSNKIAEMNQQFDVIEKDVNDIKETDPRFIENMRNILS